VDYAYSPRQTLGSANQCAMRAISLRGPPSRRGDPRAPWSVFRVLTPCIFLHCTLIFCYSPKSFATVELFDGIPSFLHSNIKICQDPIRLSFSRFANCLFLEGFVISEYAGRRINFKWILRRICSDKDFTIDNLLTSFSLVAFTLFLWQNLSCFAVFAE